MKWVRIEMWRQDFGSRLRVGLEAGNERSRAWITYDRLDDGSVGVGSVMGGQTNDEWQDGSWHMVGWGDGRWLPEWLLNSLMMYRWVARLLMDEVDGWWMDKYMMGGWMMDGQMDGLVNGWITDGWVGGWAMEDRRMGRRMDDEWLNVISKYYWYYWYCGVAVKALFGTAAFHVGLPTFEPQLHFHSNFLVIHTLERWLKN